MFVNKQLPFISLYIFRSLALMMLMITLVQSFKPSGNNNINNTLNINRQIIKNQHIDSIWTIHQWNLYYLRSYWNIKLSQSIFRVTTFFQFDSTKNTLNTLLEYTQDLDANLKTLYSELVKNNNDDHKSYDTNQQNIFYSALLTSCLDEISDCKLQITELNLQLNNIFTTLNHLKQNCIKRGIIHFLFNFLYGTSGNTEEITAIKNNMEILKGNQDILSSQIQKTFNFINLTYAETCKIVHYLNHYKKTLFR